MSEENAKVEPENLDLDPQHAQDITESGELERPQLLRKIDCAGNPEVADRQHSSRRGAQRRPAR